MKTLKDILYKAGILEVTGDTSIDVYGITADSRQVVEGGLFVATRGTQTDGHRFIAIAIENGVRAVVCEEMPDVRPENVTFVRVKDSSHALGTIASHYCDNPSTKLKLIGIGGTNGKTTIATLLYSLFTALGYCCGLISTIRNFIIEQEIPSTHTTPDAIHLNELLQLMVSQGVTHCFMEVSSHAIAQQRIAGLQFAGGVFTNITHDHLDYHGTFGEYLKAKKSFYDNLPAGSFAISNQDDRNGKVMLQSTRANKHFYSLKSLSQFNGRIIENGFEGLHLQINGRDTWFRLVGPFNAYNLMAIYATAMLLGEPSDEVLTLLSSLQPVEGRFDYFVSPAGVKAIVDYAHTPDALDNVLKTIAAVRTGNEQLITVAGAGGNRDRSKRPVMARIACEQSNLLILTSDNPRDEDPTSIIEEMRSGISPELRKKTLAIENREEAIRTACKLARPNDIILVAGKGHEKYQEVRGKKYPFDDKQILMDILEELSNTPK